MTLPSHYKVRPMTHRYRFARLYLGAILCLVGLSACTIKATTDTATDGTTEFLSSTTGKSWLTEEGLVREKWQAHAFLAGTHENLFPEIAKCEGEYVTAFMTLLDVPFPEQGRTCRMMQARFSRLMVSWSAQDLSRLDWLIREVQSLSRS